MAIYVPLGLLAVAIVIMSLTSVISSRRAKSRKAHKNEQQARILVHSINDDRCTGPRGRAVNLPETSRASEPSAG